MKPALGHLDELADGQILMGWCCWVAACADLAARTGCRKIFCWWRRTPQRAPSTYDT